MTETIFTFKNFTDYSERITLNYSGLGIQTLLFYAYELQDTIWATVFEMLRSGDAIAVYNQTKVDENLILHTDKLGKQKLQSKFHFIVVCCL